jgi:hypothetical protein
MQPRVWLKRMKKKLNVDSIQSELRGGSAFFPGYKRPDAPTTPSEEAKRIGAADTPPQEDIPGNHQEKREGVPPIVPLPVRDPVPPSPPLVPKVKRPIRQRQPFDIYEDQYVQLKKIAEAEKGFVNGRGMSQMVRDAVDQYLRDHTSSKT